MKFGWSTIKSQSYLIFKTFGPDLMKDLDDSEIICPERTVLEEVCPLKLNDKATLSLSFILHV